MTMKNVKNTPKMNEIKLSDKIDGHLFLKGYDEDFEVENPPTCPNYDEDFVDWMTKLKEKWSNKKNVNKNEDLSSKVRNIWRIFE